MGFLEVLFKSYNRVLQFTSRRTNAALTPSHTDDQFQQFHYYFTERIGLQKVMQNIEKITFSKVEDYDKENFNLARAFVHNLFKGDGSMNANAVLEKMDRNAVLRNIKLVEENEKDYDPELVKLEKLKGDLLLGEEGAEERLREYVKEKPYLKKYLKWADLQEQTRYQYLG